MSATNAKAKPKKGQHYLVGDGPSVRPGGVMVPPESKNAGAAAQKEEDFSLMGAIASLSPWAVVRQPTCGRGRRRTGPRASLGPVCELLIPAHLSPLRPHVHHHTLRHQRD